jgi:hypothetical protein
MNPDVMGFYVLASVDSILAKGKVILVKLFIFIIVNVYYY